MLSYFLSGNCILARKNEETEEIESLMITVNQNNGKYKLYISPVCDF